MFRKDKWDLQKDFTTKNYKNQTAYELYQKAKKH